MAEASEGAMAAVIDLSLPQIKQILQEQGLNQLQVANYNAPSQIVISGPAKQIETARKPIEKANGRYILLKVTSAFHSSYMAAARDLFADFLRPLTLQPPHTPVIANITARPYLIDDLKMTLANQINHSVNWVDSIRYLMGKGEQEFIECGPGNVLSGLIRKIRKQAKPLFVEEVSQPEPKRTGKLPPTETRDVVLPETEKAHPVQLGSSAFCRDYHVKHAYVARALSRGISSVEMVVSMGSSGLLSFFGAGGLKYDETAAALSRIQESLSAGQPYGMSLDYLLLKDHEETRLVNLFLDRGVSSIEAVNYLKITPDLVTYRLKGVHLQEDGTIKTPNRIMAYVSRPEIAALFMKPAPAEIVKALLQQNRISREEARLAEMIPMAGDLCAMADSGGITSQAPAYSLLPAMLRLRDEMNQQFAYAQPIRLGTGGGIGTPEAAAAAFTIGADFIATGSINQATLEAGTSKAVKERLVKVDVQDTTQAPVAETFEIGSHANVLKRGLFFAARAKRLHTIYLQHGSLEDIDQQTRRQIQEKYFKCDFAEVWRLQCQGLNKGELEKAENNPKWKMLQVFKWYFERAWDLAQKGSRESSVDYLVHCGPAMGAFNRWQRGTSLENHWERRRVAYLADLLMEEAGALVLNRSQRFLDSGHKNHQAKVKLSFSGQKQNVALL